MPGLIYPPLAPSGLRGSPLAPFNPLAHPGLLVGGRVQDFSIPPERPLPLTGGGPLYSLDALTYTEKIRRLFGSSIIGYWPGGENSGAVADDVSPSANLMTNGGFETAGAGGADIWGTWAETAGDGALANEAAIILNGTAAAKVTAGATANTEITNTVEVAPGRSYDLSFWTRGDGANGGRYAIYDVTNAAYILAITNTEIKGATYAPVSRSFIAPAGCVSVRIELWCPSKNTGIVYFDDVQLISQKHGAYTGVTLGQEGIGDGLTCPLYDGALDYMQPPAGFRTAFNNQEFTVMIWGIFEAATWADGLVKRLLSFRADANNWVTLAKGAPAGGLAVNYIAGGTNKALTITTSSPLIPFHLTMTVSKSGDAMKAYLNGVQNGATQTGLGIWAGALLATDTLIGAQTTAPAQVCNGRLAHALALNIAATPAEVAAAAAVI